MKVINLFSLILVMAMITVSCQKEPEVGPRGPAGADGNANVIVYLFGDTTLSGSTSITYTLDGVTPGMADTCLILPYYNTGTMWYLVGGLGAGANYQTRFWTWNTDPLTMGIRLHNPDGSLYTGIDVIWEAVKVYVMSPTEFRMAQDNNIDFNNYDQVNAYFPNNIK